MNPRSWLCLATCGAWLLLTHVVRADEPTLTSIPEVRSLSRAEALRGRGVRLEGCITYVDPVWNFMFLQNGEDAIFIHGVTNLLYEQGHYVSVSGRTSFEYFPFVESTEVRVLAEAEESPGLPKATEASRCGPATDCKLVRCRVEIESALVRESRCVLAATAGGQRLFCTIAGTIDPEEMISYVGATVNVTGAQGLLIDVPSFYKPGSFSEEPKVLGPQILMQGIGRLEIVAAEKQDPLPEIDTTVHALYRGQSGKRFRFPGQISFVGPDFVVVEANAVGIKLRSDCTYGLMAGQTIEAWVERVADDGGGRDGLKAIGFRTLFSSPLPRPDPIQAVDAAKLAPNRRRVTVRGRIRSLRGRSHGVDLELESGGVEFGARLANDIGSQLQLDLKTAKTVEVTGALLQSADPASEKAPFQIATHQLDDWVVTSRTGEFSWQSLWIGVALLAVLLAGSYAWIRSLGFLVAERTQSLSELNAFFRTSYESLTDGMVAEDAAGRIVATNSAFTDAFGSADAGLSTGTQVEDAIGHKVRSGALDRLIAKVRSNPGSRGSIEFATSETPPRDFVVSTAPIVRDQSQAGGESEETIGRVWLFRDETERKQLESGLLHAQKMESVGTLASGMAHDFNNILCAVANSLAVIGLDTLTSTQRESLEMANRNVFRAADVIRKLLTFSDRQLLQRELVPINEVVQESCSLLRHLFDASIRFNVDLADEAGSVRVDRTMFEQVLMNLCVNARDALGSGGTITLRTWPAGETSRDDVKLSVSDDGHGMDEVTRHRIFDPFFSTKRARGGSGLGACGFVSNRRAAWWQDRMSFAARPWSHVHDHASAFQAGTG